jgi:hypothetical protein
MAAMVEEGRWTCIVDGEQHSASVSATMFSCSLYMWYHLAFLNCLKAGTLIACHSVPERFCEFLLNQCKEHNVTVLHPATATSVTTDRETGLPVALSYTTPESSEYMIPCNSLLLTAGPWTGRVYEKLFPKSQLKLPISNLAGWSVVFRDPTPTVSTSTASCHSVFTTSASEKFSPEVFGRILPSKLQEKGSHPQDVGRDIYLAGLNSSDIPLPNIATEVETTLGLQDPQIASLLRAAKKIFSPLPAVNMSSEATMEESHSLEVLRVIVL